MRAVGLPSVSFLLSQICTVADATTVQVTMPPGEEAAASFTHTQMYSVQVSQSSPQCRISPRIFHLLYEENSLSEPSPVGAGSYGVTRLSPMEPHMLSGSREQPIRSVSSRSSQGLSPESLRIWGVVRRMCPHRTSSEVFPCQNTCASR